jgi:hypothetical protein
MRKLLESNDAWLSWVRQFYALELGPRNVPISAHASSAWPPIDTAVSIEGSDFAAIQSDGICRIGDTLIADVSGIASCPVENGFAFYMSEDRSLTFLRSGRPQLTVPHVCLPRLVVAADGRYFLWLSPPSIVYRGPLSGREMDPIFYIAKSNILKMAVSARFHIAALSCDDRKVRIRCLTNGKKVATIDLDGELAVELFVTRGFGFVVIVTASRIALLTTNGSVAKAVRYDFGKVTSWFTWMSQSGMDYIGFVDENGRIYYFEAYYPERLVAVACFDGIAAVKYDCSSRSFRILMRTGRVENIEHELMVVPISEK